MFEMFEMPEQVIEKYKKGNYYIQATKAAPGTPVYNHLEDCHYVTNEQKCIILTGTAGEQWPVTFEKLVKTYDAVFPLYGRTEIKDFEGTITVSPKASADFIYAYQTKEKVDVVTSWGEILHANRDGVPHGDGDFIVFAADRSGKINKDDSWVVNGEIFLKTYEEVHEGKDFNSNDVYIMTHNVVRQAVTGEDLYHGMNFADCKAWCECHDYAIVDDIW